MTSNKYKHQNKIVTKNKTQFIINPIILNMNFTLNFSFHSAPRGVGRLFVCKSVPYL